MRGLSGSFLMTMNHQFDSLLPILNEKAIHQCCIKVLLTEAYKYLNGIPPI